MGVMAATVSVCDENRKPACLRADAVHSDPQSGEPATPFVSSCSRSDAVSFNSFRASSRRVLSRDRNVGPASGRSLASPESTLGLGFIGTTDSSRSFGARPGRLLSHDGQWPIGVARLFRFQAALLILTGLLPAQS